MRRLFSFVVCVVASLGILGSATLGASRNPDRMSQGDLDRAAEIARSFWAFCDSPHGLTVGWAGPTRATYEAARKDADDHQRQFKHNTAVAND